MTALPLPPVPTRVVAAPMAGGPSTVALAAAVGEAGGLGFLAAGYRTADAVAEEVGRLRATSTAPFGVNVFTPVPAGSASEVRAYAELVAPRAAALGVELGKPVHSDDDHAAKVAVLAGLRPAVVSFAFGLPPAESVERLHAAGVPVWLTVTSPEDAAAAAAAGADALVVQGWEAGGHRGGLSDPEPAQLGLLPLLALVRRVTDLPLVAAGGIGDGRGVAAVLAAGAALAQLGTAFLRTPEAGTAPVHAAALAEERPTTVTRAFTGRSARALVNRATTELSGAAPAAYPEVHFLTQPLRAAARAAGDGEELHMWAGQAHVLAEAVPAGELVRRLAADAREAMAAARF
ncbi:nitronate monooxygenase [Blastococcus sp. URHD0036]|uniref:nitronate monooxygenase n=1 Tax=Blastococcus sp. URHD0036 TaxID=1380356 RepID=UPI00068C8668|nr:nitronate monooxygenase [Blastococcus sp. URHD0036]